MNGLNGEFQAVSEQKDKLSALTNSPEWGMLRAFCESQVALRLREVVLTQISSEVDIAKHNYVRGEIAFAQTLIRWMEDQFSVTSETVELYKQALSERGEQENG